MFASIGGPDELLFRALNLAGANPTLDAIMILITTLGGTYIVALFAVPLWLRGQREATFARARRVVCVLVAVASAVWIVVRVRMALAA